MDKRDILSRLVKVPFLHGLTGKDLELILDGAEVRSFAGGDALIEEGQTNPPFQVVLEGVVKVVLPPRPKGSAVKRAAEVRLNTLRSGDCFGEYSLLDDMNASASVVGEELGSVLVVPNEHFRNVLASDDRIARIVYHNMLRALVGRLKRRESQLELPLIVG